MFGDGKDWHGRSLSRAFKRRGITPLLVPLNACGFSTETATGLSIPGLGDRLPEGAFVRFVPGGTFEEVTLYLGVLHGLRELGVTVWNDARAIERCVDKSTTTFFLQRAGIPTPRTFARVNRAEAEADRVLAARRGAEAGAEAAIRGARQRVTPDRLARRSLLARGGERGLLSPGVRRAGASAPSGLAAVRMPRPRHRLHDQARIELDHQYQARRPRQGGDREPGAGRSRAARRRLASAPIMPGSTSSRRVTAASSCWKSIRCRPGMGCSL